MPMTNTKQIRSILFSVLAVLSLFVSTVSACACAHHRADVKPAEDSCHVQSHSSREGSVQTAESETGIDEVCTCFVNQPSPYVLAKSDKKKSADQTPVFDIPVDRVLVETDLSISQTSATHFGFNSNLYFSLLSISTPSRAPPRL